MYQFTYHRPSTVKETVSLLKKNPQSKILAGGQTLIPTLKQRLAQPSDVIDLSALEDLKGIRETERNVFIGAMTKHAEVATSSVVKTKIPALASLAAEIGDPQVRNRGTIGGSICNNDPAADYPAAILGLDAKIQTNQRTILADNFFVDLFETALTAQEIVMSIQLPIPDKAAYQMFPNPASRYAIVGVFIAKFGTSVRVAVTGAAPCVFRASEMEVALQKEFSTTSLNNITISPERLNQDIHASREYRAHLISVMAKRAITQMI